MQRFKICSSAQQGLRRSASRFRSCKFSAQGILIASRLRLLGLYSREVERMISKETTARSPWRTRPVSDSPPSSSAPWPGAHGNLWNLFIV